MSKPLGMLTISQAAKLLGVHPDTLRRWEKAGKLSPIRFVKRGHRRYRSDEIMDLIKNSTQQKADPSPTLERVLKKDKK
jgi:excisionase family DNA binding protein